MKHRISLIVIFVVLVCMLLCSACRFKIPTVREQEELVSLGVFPNGIPAWVAADKGQQNKILSPVVPTSFGVPPQTSSWVPEKQQEVVFSKQEDNTKEISEDDEGRSDSEVLKRIIQMCPNLENYAIVAMVETNLEKRSNQLATLTNRCPQSVDLWVWLGRDYLTVGKLLDAKRSFEEAVVLEPKNKQIRSLLQAVESQLEIK